MKRICFRVGLVSLMSLFLVSAARADSTGGVPISERLSAAGVPLEERLAKRFARPDTAESLTRVGGEGERITSAVIGSEHPELLLPHELFRHLVLLTVESPNSNFRAHYRQKFLKTARAAGIPLGPTFFEDVVGRTREYVAVRSRFAENPEMFAREECLTAHRAFADLERSYGADLQRFLYVAVAPEMNVTTTDTAEDYRRGEEGCQ